MLLGAAIIPMIVIYIINFVIIIRVMHFVKQLGSNARSFQPANSGANVNGGDVTREALLSSLKSFLLLVPVLGIPLLFGFLTSECFRNDSWFFNRIVFKLIKKHLQVKWRPNKLCELLEQYLLRGWSVICGQRSTSCRYQHDDEKLRSSQSEDVCWDNLGSYWGHGQEHTS